MKARLMKKWGTNYAGQILTNVEKGSIPADVAEYFEDDDPAVNTVVSQATADDPLRVINDEINPEHAKAHNEAQRAAAKDSEAALSGGGGGVVAAHEALEREQTQDRARNADNVAAERQGTDKDATAGLSEGQKSKNAAGKGPATTAKAGKGKKK
jgi:hypothetical protein